MSIWAPVANKPSNESMVPLAFRSTPRPPADRTTEPLPWITVSVPAGPKPCPTELIDKVAIPLWASADATAKGLLFLLLLIPCTKIATGQQFAGRGRAAIHTLNV